MNGWRCVSQYHTKCNKREYFVTIKNKTWIPKTAFKDIGNYKRCVKDVKIKVCFARSFSDYKIAKHKIKTE